jgi:PhoU domain
VRRRSTTRPAPWGLLPDGHPAPSSAEPPNAATFVVEPGEPPEHLFRSLLGAYLGGAAEFEVRLDRRGASPDARDVVVTFCHRTRQPELVEDRRGILRLRDAAPEISGEVPNRLRRMGAEVVEFHRQAVASWSKLSLVDETFWDRKDDEIDRDAWQIQRWAARQLSAPSLSVGVFGPWTIARSLERIADHAVVLGQVGARFADFPDGVLSATSLTQFHHQALEHLGAVLATTDPAGANDLLDVGEALLQSGRSVADRLLSTAGRMSGSPGGEVAVSRVLDSISRTIAYTQDIAQVFLDGPMRWEAVPARAPNRVPPPQSRPLPAV